MNGAVADEMSVVVGAELECDGRVVIGSWRKKDPGFLLQNGLVVCSLRHGGAKSFYEAVR